MNTAIELINRLLALPVFEAYPGPDYIAIYLTIEERDLIVDALRILITVVRDAEDE
jgi:hypothetical protein